MTMEVTLTVFQLDVKRYKLTVRQKALKLFVGANTPGDNSFQVEWVANCVYYVQRLSDHMLFIPLIFRVHTA